MVEEGERGKESTLHLFNKAPLKIQATRHLECAIACIHPMAVALDHNPSPSN
jgi:hypothetical protein